MKRYLIFLSVLPFALFSCVRDVDDLFDRSASERIDDAIARYDQLLRGNTNGWIVEYYPEAGRAYGGFNLYFKFEAADRAIVGSDIAGGNTFAESLYSMNSDMGPTLNFDTYNSILHYFSDPGLPVGAGAGFGYEGDYEFVLVSGTESEIMMRGKKTQNTIRMIPLPADMTWADYLTAVDQMITDIETLAYGMTVDGRNLSSIVRSGDKSFIISYEETYTDENGQTVTETITLSVPFIFTATGLRFYEPLNIYGQTIQGFIYDAATETLNADNADAQIFKRVPSDNEYFVLTSYITQWYFIDMSSTMQTLWNSANAALLANGFSIAWGYLGQSLANEYTGPSLFFAIEGGGSLYAVGYAFTFSDVSDTEDQVAMVYDSPFANGSVGFVLNAFTPFINALNDNSPYRVAVNYDADPISIRFESVGNPDINFVVELE